MSRYSDSRESARHLLRWLAETLNLSAAGLSYHDEASGYRWQERVGRIVPGAETGGIWEHPFPAGRSRWILEGDRSKLREIESVLDLLADQWLYLGASSKQAPETPSRAVPEPRIPAWTAVSRGARIILSRLPQISLSGKPLLLIGENGVGKSHLAGLIHANGPDPSAPFAVPGEQGDSGTLFVDDWQNRSSNEKSSCLKDVRRVIAAVVPRDSVETHRQAWLRRTDGSGVTLTIPPLRDRREDIPSLAGRFLEEFTVSTGNRAPEIAPGALEALTAYSWPGNARELRECLRQVMDRVEPWSRIVTEHLPPAVRGAVSSAAGSSFPEKLVALEYEALRKELSRQRGNMTRTAQALGLTPRQVSWRLRKYGIDPREFKPHLRAERS